MSRIKGICPHCKAEITAELAIRRVEKRTFAHDDPDDHDMWEELVEPFVHGLVETSMPEIGAHLGLPEKELRAPFTKGRIARIMRKLGWVSIAVREGEKVLRKWRISPVNEKERRVADELSAQNVERIRTLVAGYERPITIGEICTGLGVPKEQWDEAMRLRIEQALKSLGWSMYVDSGRYLWQPPFVDDSDTPQHK